MRPACPFHRHGGCQLALHGTYARQPPPAMRVRRFLCPRCGHMVSLLPDCLTARMGRTLAEVEQVVRTVEKLQQPRGQNTLKRQSTERYAKPPRVIHNFHA